MSIVKQFAQEIEASVDGDNVVSIRDALAARIRDMAAAWGQNTVSLGKELKAAQDTFPIEGQRGNSFSRPGWPEWVEANCGFTAGHATKFIRIWETFGTESTGALPVNGSARLLEFLASGNTPASVKEEVFDRLGKGEIVGLRQAKKIKAKHTAPPASEARKIAAETGVPTLARDGNIYLGATKEQEQEAEDRRRIVYGIRRAVETLAEMQMTGAEFLSYAFKHQLWKADEEHQITEAYEWLTDLVAAWERR